MNEEFTIIRDTFGKQDSDEKVEGLTLIIDGKMKEVFDIIIQKSDKYKDYSSLMSAIIIFGVNKIINDL